MIDLNQDLFKTLDLVPLPCIGWDELGRITYWNQRAESILGWEVNEVLGEDLGAVIGVDLKEVAGDIVAELGKNDLATVHRTKVTTKAGKGIIYEWTTILLSPKSGISGISMAKDITQLEVLQKKMVESRRLASLGQLLGKISHEINNLLMGVIGYLSLAQEELEGRKAQGDIISALKAAKSMKSLMNSMLSHSKEIKAEKGPCDINIVVGEAVNFMRKILPGRISIRSVSSGSRLRVKATNSILFQVFLNLIINARDAISDEGSISIKTDMIYKPLDENSFDEGEKFVSVSVTDTGCGMLEEIKERVFEPFFTTKENSGGTGLGLSFVYDSVKDLGGWIDVESQKGMGSRFTVYLPLEK